MTTRAELPLVSFRLPYKNDIFGNPIHARVISRKAPKQATNSPRPIALIYHAGGLVVGNSDVIPRPQIDHLLSAGFVIVAPNYRLLPQLTGKEAFDDSEDAFDWATTVLPAIMQDEHDIQLDSSAVVAMGHSSGGTMVLNLASRKPVQAVLSLYPFLFISDPSTNPTAKASVSEFEDLVEVRPSEAIDWTVVTPEGKQVSEAELNLSGGPPDPRQNYATYLFTTGQWLKTMQPDGNFTAVDPMTRLRPDWPPVRLIHGAGDNIPGRSVALMNRAQQEMKAAGVREVELEIVDGGHLFDHVGGVGTTDQGPKWQAVVRGLDWLISRARTA